MKPQHPPEADASRRMLSLARVRTEVAAALRQVAPSETQLIQALERVELLLADSRAELAALMHEMEALVEPRGRSRPAVVPIDHRPGRRPR